ncbi:MAG: hypothetical protein HY583_00565 [Candidatus Omnitrophica bacterium]|nr:hypothetical protein [Candidatus Omnitrophota bacterium]
MNQEPTVYQTISFAWKKTIELLFPFEWKRWLKILLIVWLAGHAAGMGGNFRVPRQVRPAAETDQPVRSQTPVPPSQKLQESLDQLKSEAASSLASEPATLTSDQVLERFPSETPPKFSLLFILIAVPILLVLLWVSARFNFIFLELVVKRDVPIKEGFAKCKLSGNSYFKWLVVFGLVGIGALVLNVALIVFAISFAKPLLLILVPLLIFFIVALAVVMTLVDDFILPIMYQDSSRILEAVKRFFSFRLGFGSLALYLLIKFGLGVLSMIVLSLLGILIGAVILAVGLLTALLGSFLATVLSFLKPILLIVGILLLISIIIAVILFIGLITLPIPVFFRVFSLSYFPRLVGNYNLLTIPTSKGESSSSA